MSAANPPDIEGSKAIPAGLRYQRSILLEARGGGDDALVVLATLEDPEHRFCLSLRADASGIIQNAWMEVEDAPFASCRLVGGSVACLHGVNVLHGLPREVRNLLDGSMGCFHLRELTEPAVHFAANILTSVAVGWNDMHPPQPGLQAKMKQSGRIQCIGLDAVEESLVDKP